ncbi:MAG: hypothetical protein ACPG51_19910 [Thiolinea sp.]
MNNSTPFYLYRLACRLLALVCMAYMSVVLYSYLQVDAFGYLPSFGQWLIGLFLLVMTIATGKGKAQFINPLFLTGLAGLVAIY